MADVEATAHAAHGAHEPVGSGLYVRVWGALVALTAVTVGISYVDLQNISVVTALVIATTKAALVLAYFMHLRFESRLFFFMLLAALGFLGVSIGLIFVDYSYR